VQNRDVLVPLVESLMRTRTTAAWEELLRGAEVPHAPVWSYADLFAHPEMSQRLRLTVRDPAGRPRPSIEDLALPDPTGENEGRG
jgi:crotonobetainyl-CoA:carnitine CoA-transferase CaiB-like acyl-CoA transferase